MREVKLEESFKMDETTRNMIIDDLKKRFDYDLERMEGLKKGYDPFDDYPIRSLIPEDVSGQTEQEEIAYLQNKTKGAKNAMEFFSEVKKEQDCINYINGLINSDNPILRNSIASIVDRSNIIYAE